eukprot:2467735-Amphidinium_carterae.1
MVWGPVSAVNSALEPATTCCSTPSSQPVQADPWSVKTRKREVLCCDYKRIDSRSSTSQIYSGYGVRKGKGALASMTLLCGLLFRVCNETQELFN